MKRLLRRYLRVTLATTLLYELHIPHRHATVCCFAHILDGQEGDLDYDEKLTQNYDLRKSKKT
jgi:hypothetical protein